MVNFGALLNQTLLQDKKKRGKVKSHVANLKAACV